MSISWKVLAAAAAVTAVLSGCSSVSLDEGDKAGTLAGEQTGAQTTAVNPSWIRPIRFTTVRFISRLTLTKFRRSMPLWLKPTPSGLLLIRK